MGETEAFVTLVMAGIALFLVVLWILLPFMVRGVSNRLDQLIKIHRETNKGLQIMLDELREQRNVEEEPRSEHETVGK